MGLYGLEAMSSSWRNKKLRAKTEVDEKTDALVVRLASAHTNQLESLGVYAASIAAASAVGVSPVALGNAAAVYVGARSAYDATRMTIRNYVSTP